MEAAWYAQPENQNRVIGLLSVVIPTYNEESKLPVTLKEIIIYFDEGHADYEIIIVDDGSTDTTQLKIEEFQSNHSRIRLLKNGRNSGKGFSVKKGILAAKGEYILFCDADGSTPISELEKLLRKLRAGDDIAIGSRGLRLSQIKVRQPVYREYMGKIFNRLVRLFAVPGISDTQCGFKCFKRVVARELFNEQTLNHFSFDVEILYLAQKRGYKIAEVPVIWVNSPESCVSLIKDPLRMLFDLLRIPLIHGFDGKR